MNLQRFILEGLEYAFVDIFAVIARTRSYRALSL